jgi:ssDNA-binding Zn-finger/Zn-ribbon topoisomerase 1
MKCPKCGSEMRLVRTLLWADGSGDFWRCKCGHEEKVGGGKE